MGRVLYVREARRFDKAQQIINAYQARALYRDKNGLDNWAEWAQRNLHDAAILNLAAKAYSDAE